MVILKLKSFSRWAKSERLSDTQIRTAVREIAFGLIDADLGCGLLKKRIARNGQGKRGGFRTLLAFKRYERVIFLFGFAKNERENISIKQLAVLKQMADKYLNLSLAQVQQLIEKGHLKEVNYYETN